MKNFITITCSLLLFYTINAQITEELEYFNDIDSVMVNIDKTNFTSNILYDRASSEAKLKNYNTSENNTSNVTHFEQAFSELFKASKQQKFTTIENLRNKYSFDKNTVEIGIINTRFQSLNYNKEDEQLGGLVYDSINKKLTEIPNQQFFTSKNALIIAPLKKNAVGGTINFVFKNDLLFEENNSKTIVNLTANFDNNETHTIISNSSIILNTIPINYNENGNKIIEFNVTFSDGITKTTYGQLYVKINLPPNGLRIINATIPFQGYEESTPVLGRLEYRVFYSNPNNETLNKPIVFIDGFDPQDVRKIIDADYDGSPNDHISIVELMVFGENDTPIIPLLNARGYDVIIVNHPKYNRLINGVVTEIDGGADYIERNAMAHIKLYQTLNQELENNGS